MKAISLLFTLLFSSLVFANPLNKIVVFGDSLSDTGNLYEYMEHKLPQSPPYFAGRFSNGPIWVERLIQSYYPSESSQHLVDYAFGGAGISADESDDVLFSLRRQINDYLATNQGTADENSLYIVWIGANNYLGLPEDVERALNDANNGMIRDILHLVEAGAKHIFLVNIPDLGQTPIAKAFKAKETLSYYSQRHNELLFEKFNELQQLHPEVEWIYFDVGNEVKKIIANPERYGFENVTETCYDVEVLRAPKPFKFRWKINPTPKVEADVCEGYFYFDPVHPTVHVHRILADYARMLLDEAGIMFN